MNAQLNRKVIKTTSRLEKDTEKLKQEAQKAASSPRVLFIMALTTLFLLGGGFFYAFYQVSRWYDAHTVKFHAPVKIQVYPVVAVEERFVSPLPSVKDQERQKENEVKRLKEEEAEKLAERIYQYVRYLESELGFNTTPTATHLYCQSIGKVNEIGYFPQGNKKYCFSTEAKQKEGFMFEYHDRMSKGYTVSEFLCEWVTGVRQPQCRRSMDIIN